MKQAILLWHCPDQPGIVAQISELLHTSGANIIDAQQHSTDPMRGHFFLRIAFYCPQAIGIKELKQKLQTIAQTFAASWQLHDTHKPLKATICASKTDHCLQELLYLHKTGELPLEIERIISNHPTHKELAKQYKVAYHQLKSKDKPQMEQEILKLCKKSDFLILARYMQILREAFLNTFAKPIINIHHSFLPSFKGADPYKQAYERGVKIIGATAHFVTKDLDEGPIIAQNVKHISHRDDYNELKTMGRNLEKQTLAEAIQAFCQRRIILFEGKTIVFD